MHSLRGNLLVASSRLLDPNFARSVVLIVRHDESGALGLVLNHQTDITVSSFCQRAEMDIECGIEGFLFHGGPCNGPLMILHTYPDHSDWKLISADDKNAHDIWFSDEGDHVTWLLRNNQHPIRCFLGYAGWTAGQLEAEMAEGSWLTAQGTASRIFDETDQLWSRIMLELAFGRPLDPRLIPPDPSLN